MEIPQWPYEQKFQAEVTKLDISDPEVEEFFFNLSSINDNGLKESKLYDKHMEILQNLDKYTETQILQYAAVLLKFSPKNSPLLAGRIMKEWLKAKGRVQEIASEVADEAIEII